MNKLFEENQALVTYMLDKIPYHLKYEYDDLLQEGMVGLWKAALTFKPELGYQFSTYACVVIRQVMYRYIHQKGLIIRPPTSDDEWNKWEFLFERIIPLCSIQVKDKKYEVSNEILVKAEQIKECLATLSGRNGQICRMRFHEELDYSSIGNKFKISKERVRQILTEMLNGPCHEYMRMKYDWCFCYKCQAEGSQARSSKATISA